METPKIIFFVSNEKLEKFHEEYWDSDPVEGVTKESYMDIVRSMSGGYSMYINTITISLPRVLLVATWINIITTHRESCIIKYIDHVITHEFLHYLMDEFGDTEWISVRKQHNAINSMGYGSDSLLRDKCDNYGKRN